MYQQRKITSKVRDYGFTIVEVLVVIAILGILAGLSVFGFNGWQNRLAQSEAKSDLAMLATAMQNAKNFGSGYPTSIPSTFEGSENLTIEYIGGNSTSYCIEARSKKVSSVVFNIRAGSAAVSGSCDSAYALNTPSPTLSSASQTSITISWAAIPGASSYRVQYGPSTPSTVAGCTTSPCTIGGLTASTQYKVTVTAVSAYNSKTSSVLNASTTASALRCNSGDTLSGSTCTQTYAATYNPATSGRYTCPSGGTLSGSTCTTNQAYAATWVDGGGDFCNPPDVPYSPGVCQTPDGSLMSSESQGYTCPEGGSVSGTTCYYRTYAATYQSGTAAYYSCPSGGSLSGTTCTRTYPAY